MRIKTPNGILEGDTITEIIKKHGKDCLQGTDLRGADLHGADLRYAGLRDADFDGARNIPLNVIAQTSILPDEGDVIGWKQAKDFIIVKLLIPSDAQRSNANATESSNN